VYYLPLMPILQAALRRKIGYVGMSVDPDCRFAEHGGYRHPKLRGLTRPKYWWPYVVGQGQRVEIQYTAELERKLPELVTAAAAKGMILIIWYPSEQIAYQHEQAAIGRYGTPFNWEGNDPSNYRDAAAMLKIQRKALARTTRIGA
jgi:hypothetical protein